ncbi:MAG: serine hydroxymethyltransferase [Patescibacteria group bacterium]|nr:serine hydroxymethyltransferase [Patescibacteria group bacterium]MDD4304745.1 serine hydroxymethyltransferase [Patescibacteria group bacterium]MDD4695500.1 serine hydroxymethyltransferase [Patescibacteria group bacterium]
MINKKDNDLFEIINQELERQQDGLEMIASENYVSENVLHAMGSILTNKYSEGYPGKRYYGGNEFIDEIENLGRDYAKRIFQVDHANLQPYSGSPANQAVYFALCEPHDKVMGMNLLYGGHLTHGWKVNFSGMFYDAIQYTTDKNGFLDYNAIENMIKKEKPKLVFVGATAYSRIIDFEKLAEITHKENAFLVADIAHIAGLIAGGVHPSPAGFADVITTTTHKTLRGPRGAMIMCDGDPSNPTKKPEPAIGWRESKQNIPTYIDRAVFPGLQGGPHNQTTAGITQALFEAQKPEFKEYAEQIVKNAKTLAEELTNAGLKIITGGTDNHLLLIDVTPFGISGAEAEKSLELAGITVNKNTIPFDTRGPFDPSGIRIGTPALTSREMKESEMIQISEMITKILKNYNNKEIIKKVKSEIKNLCDKFPIYKNIKY